MKIEEKREAKKEEKKAEKLERAEKKEEKKEGKLRWVAATELSDMGTVATDTAALNLAVGHKGSVAAKQLKDMNRWINRMYAQKQGK